MHTALAAVDLTEEGLCCVRPCLQGDTAVREQRTPASPWFGGGGGSAGLAVQTPTAAARGTSADPSSSLNLISNMIGATVPQGSQPPEEHSGCRFKV